MTSKRSLVILSSLFLLLAPLVGCPNNSHSGGGDGQDPLPDLDLLNVETEASMARKATITEEGGSLTVTDRRGVVYTLDIPASALTEETEVSLYPIDTVTTLPADAQVLGGVHFLPDGLPLQLNATLTMEFPGGVDVASLFAVTYSGDGADAALNISRLDGRTLTMQIQHFSGGIAVSGQEAFAALGLESASDEEEYVDRIAAASRGLSANDPALTAAVLPIYVEWYQNLVRPALVEGGTTQLDAGIVEEYRRVYENWRSIAAMTGILPELQAQVADATPLAAAYLRQRFESFNRTCIFTADFSTDIDAPFGPVAAAASALDVGAIAQHWGIPREPNNLHDEYLLDHVCVKVVIDTLLPENLDRAGDTGMLTVGAHFTINGGPARTDLPIHIRLTRGGSPFGSPSSGRQDSSGFFDSAITWPVGVDPLTIDVLARIDRSGFRKIARFDRVTLGCTPPQVNAITPLIGGRFSTGVFRADIAGEPTSYEWNFGGGATPNTSTESAPFVTFGETGFFQGSFTLTSDCTGSTVHFFDYEVQALRFDAFEYSGTVTEEYPAFGISCSGPARAEFSVVTVSGFPEFRVTYEFGCPNRPLGVAVLFPYNQEDLDEVSFVTRDGLGMGEVAADHLSFHWSNESGTTSFEGDVVPP